MWNLQDSATNMNSADMMIQMQNPTFEECPSGACWTSVYSVGCHKRVQSAMFCASCGAR